MADEKGKVIGIASGGGGASASNTGGSVGQPPFLGGGAYGYQGLTRNVQENLSFIEDSEQIQVQSLIDEQFRQLTKTETSPGVTLREHARLTRYFAAVKIFIRPEEMSVIEDVKGNKQTLYLPDTVRAEDRYQSCVGLVVALGPQAFKDKDGNPRGQVYRVGDWIVFPRTDIIRIDFCDIALGILTDDRAVIVTDDPKYWTQGSLKFKA